MKRKFYFVLMSLFMAMASFAQGPVVYLPLDSDLKDASGNSNDATNGGVLTTQFVNDEVRGKVAFFDTSAHAVLPKIDALRFGAGQDFAYAMWVKIDRIGGDPAIIGNKDWNNGRNKGVAMYVKNADVPGSANLGINFSDGPSDQGGSHNRLYWNAFENGAPDVIDGTWHFIAASFDRDDTLRVWVDGEPQYSAVAMSIAPGYAYDNTNDYPFRIMEDGTGKYNTGSGLKGFVDEVRIWNRTLTNSEVKKLYSGNKAGPIVYLPLDTDLKDASGNSNDATDGGVLTTQFVNDEVRGKVAFFDTSAHAVLPKIDSLRFGPNHDFAYAMWVKIDRIGGDPAICGNKDWNSGRNKGVVMYVKNADVPGSANLGINFSDGPSDQGGSHNRLYWNAFENGAPDIIDGTWHSIAASFDRDDTLRVWVDGEPQYSAIAMSIAPGYAYDNTNDYPFRIMEDGTGKYNTGSGLKGYIDEVRIWNNKITTDDIKEAYGIKSKAEEPAELSLKTTVYPNPSNGLVNINFNLKKQGETRIQVYTNTGVLVNEISHSAIAGQNKVNFNVNGWVPGIYLVRILSESTSEAVRLMVTE